MSKRRGRPSIENKKDKDARFRMTEEEAQAFNNACEKLDLDKSEILRLAVSEFLSTKNIQINFN